ncbi:hypothetical protein CAK78_13340 [Aeromonas sp. A35_P]|nr:hypothetical protein CAK78_13340 [Aeromonas sp. A35_P]
MPQSARLLTRWHSTGSTKPLAHQHLAEEADRDLWLPWQGARAGVGERGRFKPLGMARGVVLVRDASEGCVGAARCQQ